MIKRLFILALSAVIFAGNCDFVKAYADTQDEVVNFLRTQNVFENEPKFYPDKLVNRGEYVMWTLRNREIFFEDNERLLEPFLDIGSPQNFAPYVAKAWQLGILDTAKRFYPLQKITKIDALRILFATEGIIIPRSGFYLHNYKDLPKDSIERGAIAKALEMRIIKPKNDDEFGVHDYLTRLEVANLLYNIRLSVHADQILFNAIQIGAGREKEDVFNEVWDIIHNRYLNADDVKDIDLMEAAISGMVNSLGDEYTIYFPKSDTKNFLQPLEGDLQGIGAQVDIEPSSGYILIVAPLKGTPAERAGLKSGDLIIKVDGVDIKGMSLDDTISLIKGPAGTVVNLQINRDGKVFDVSIIREKIDLKSIYSNVKNGYLIIEIALFGQKTIREFQELIDRSYNQNIKGIIIDLRGNPGGYLDSAVDLLEFFFEPGRIGVITESVNSMIPIKLNGTGYLKDVPLAVIINDYSASASEIFAGAVQDYERGLILGKKSYGKGTVQELNQFYDGSSFKVTVAEWKTPKKRSIDGIGIKPDIEVKSDGDEVIDIAIRELNNGKGRPKQ